MRWRPSNWKSRGFAPPPASPSWARFGCQWWRQALDDAFAGTRPAPHPVVEAVSTAIRRRPLARNAFRGIVGHPGTGSGANAARVPGGRARKGRVVGDVPGRPPPRGSGHPSRTDRGGRARGIDGVGVDRSGSRGGNPKRRSDFPRRRAWPIRRRRPVASGPRPAAGRESPTRRGAARGDCLVAAGGSGESRSPTTGGRSIWFRACRPADSLPAEHGLAVVVRPPQPLLRACFPWFYASAGFLHGADGRQGRGGLGVGIEGIGPREDRRRRGRGARRRFRQPGTAIRLLSRRRCCLGWIQRRIRAVFRGAILPGVPIPGIGDPQGHDFDGGQAGKHRIPPPDRAEG